MGTKNSGAGEKSPCLPETKGPPSVEKVCGAVASPCPIDGEMREAAAMFPKFGSLGRGRECHWHLSTSPWCICCPAELQDDNLEDSGQEWGSGKVSPTQLLPASFSAQLSHRVAI